MKEKSKKRPRGQRLSDLDAVIGQNLRALRQAHGMPQAALAKKLGVTFQQLQKYEKGENRLSAARLYALIRFFNVPCDYFFQGISESGCGETRPVRVDPALLRVVGKISALEDPVLKSKIVAALEALTA